VLQWEPTLPSPISSCLNSQAAVTTTAGAMAEVVLAIAGAVGAVLAGQVVYRESSLAIATRLRLTSN
jgi:hypothetical protein